jgi:steroid delta-isomerase-like uncharacterized protein
MNLRKLFYCAIVGVAITGSISSCQKADSSACEKLKIADEKLNENIKKYETTWDQIINQRKIELIDPKMFDKNVTLVSKPNNIVGIAAFRDYYKNYLVGFSEIKFTVVDAFGQDDRIVKHWKFEGKHTGVFFGIPATGKSVNVEGVTLVKMKNGKVIQEQDFMDNLEFMNQLGIIPRQ